MDQTNYHNSLSTLQERLSKARLSLYELDGTEYEYEIKKAALEFEVQTLEKEVKVQQSGGYGTARPRPDDQQYEKDFDFLDTYNMPALPILGEQKRPQSSNAALLQPTGFASYSGNVENGFSGHFPSDGVLMEPGRRNMPGSWNFASLDTSGAMAGTPQHGSDNASSSISSSSPESNFAVPRKRQKPNFVLARQPCEQTGTATFTSPSPAISENTTPTSYDSFDIPEDMFAFLGGNPKDSLEEMRDEQRLQEELAEQRKMCMRRDEELAKCLQEEYNSSEWPTLQHTVGPSHAVAGPSSQARMDANGGYRRISPLSSPPVTPSTSRLNHVSSRVKQERNDDANRIIKNETTYRPTHSRFLSNETVSPFHPRPVKKEEQHQTSSSAIDFINLESDSDSALDPPIPWDSGNIIDLESDDWLQDSQLEGASHTHGASSSFGSRLSNAVGGMAQGATQFGQSLYSSAQDLLGFDSNLVYGNNSHDANYLSPFIDLSGDLSNTEMADNAFSRHGIDSSNTEMFQKYVDRINHVTNDPNRTKSEIKALLENIRPDEDLPPENREGTPEAMTYALMEHQKLGLAWLKKMEMSEQKGGILADDMGLGKTIQALALIVSRRSNDPQYKTTLIIAPVALMKQWEREIQTKLKPGSEHKLRTFILHGSNRHQTWDRLKTYDVVLTTFGTLSSELKRREGIDMKKRANPNWRPTSKEDCLPTLGDECYWYRVIIDEAQCIKNKGTKASLAASALRARFRFCMTGTPMMNSIDELYSLVRFLRISPYDDSTKFNAHFTRPLKGQSQNAKTQAMEKLQVLLKAILLRRTKKSMIDGKPILNLPPRKTEPRHATFSEDESQFYQALQTQTQLQFNRYLKAGTVGRNYSNILVLLLRLRQACCHPHLIKDFGQEGFNGDVTAEDMIKLANELALDVITRLKEQSELNDDSALECPVCMDMTENATIFIPCGHNTCSECFARISDPSQAIASGDAAETRHGEAKCPNCRGKIAPSKVIDHSTFKKVHMATSDDPLADLEDDTEVDSDSLDEGDSDSDSDTDDESEEEVDCEGNLKDFVVTDDAIDDETTDDDDAGYRSGRTPFEKASKQRKKSKGKGKAKANKPPRVTLAQLKKESRKNAKARRRYIKRLEKEWETSAKIEQTMEIIRNVQHSKHEETKQPEKIIIFSQFTSLLDLLEVPISKENWGFRRYDGSMNANQRHNAVLEFADRKDVKVMLISLKAGNAGLNLTAASQVIILDPFWNPYIEEQAIDRAHRIGQTKSVHIHRILIPNTVEDRILALQEKKRALIESALDENASQRIGRLGTRDLAFLFDVPIST